MIRFAVPLMLLPLAACATTESGVDSYTLGRGLVNYDAMARAKVSCSEVGGEVRPKGVAGEDLAQMSNYLCYIPKKAAKP